MHKTKPMAPPPAQSSSAGSEVEVHVETAGLTDVGCQRKRNEDQILIATVQRSMTVSYTSVGADVQRWFPGGSTGTILLVADGMGGAGDGDLASSVAVKAIVDHLCNVSPAATPAVPSRPGRPQNATVPGMRLGLATALEKGDQEVRRAAGEGVPGSARTRDIGTTVTLAYVVWPNLYVAHAGDSRCYLLRYGQLSQLTTDHTYAEHYRATGAELDPNSQWHHMLWNALGGGQAATLQPEVRRHQLATDDIVVLCSDGLTKHVPDESIVAVLLQQPDLTAACHQLVGMAKQAGGTDNVSVALARCHPMPPSQPSYATPPGSGQGPQQ